MSDGESIKVVAEADTFHRIARSRPQTAIAELVWNSLDADANEVNVYLDEGELGLRGIIVEDTGRGATPEEAREYFKKLGGSWKKPGARTDKGRALHGRQGQGRYKALSVGHSVIWKFFYEKPDGIYEFSLSISSSDPTEVKSSLPVKSKNGRTGCIVTIADPVKQFQNLDSEETVLEMTEIFAIYLSDYPGVKVTYAGRALDPAEAISKQFPLEVPRVIAGADSAEAGSLRVLEWSHIDRRSLYVCDARGFTLQQIPTRFQIKRRSFSAYLSSPYLYELDKENRLDLAELDALGAAVIEAAKDAIKAHYEGEDKKEAARIIQEWKTSKIYPYKDEPKDSVEEAERKVFEIVAVKLQTASSELAGAPVVAKKLQLELLRHAIETGPNQLRELLSRVIELPQREQDDLAKLLDETTLSSIIGSAKIVTDRLNFLRGLYQIVYEYNKAGRIKERSQLHRILSKNAWLFGEEFVVSTDDRDLTAALKAHRKFLDDEISIDEPVKHVSQSKGVIDLMLSRLLRRHRANEVEHLVVELKRPGVLVGIKEIGQIEQYAASIEADARFASREGVVWHYWVISDGLDQMGKWRASEDETGRGLIRKTPKSKIYVKTWDQLIEENKARYQFIQEQLNFTAKDERAMKYLREEHSALLEGVTVASDKEAAE